MSDAGEDGSVDSPVVVFVVCEWDREQMRQLFHGRSPSHQRGMILSSVLVVALLGAVILTFAVAIDRTTNGGGLAAANVRSETATVDSEVDTLAAPENPEGTNNGPVNEKEGDAAATETAAIDDSESPIETNKDKPDPSKKGASGLTAASVYALNVTTGEALRASQEDAQRPIASLTKMMTALVVARAIENGDLGLDEEVAIEPSDEVDINVYSHMGLVAGDTVTIGQLLDGMLIPSGNDAAKALARVTEERLSTSFVDEMNAEAAQLGLENTNFNNPAGDDDPDNYSSARDLALLAEQILDSDLLAGIVSTPSKSLISTGPEKREYALYNTNQLLQGFGFDGVKTGTTEAAGSCLVASTTMDNGDRLIIVVLGSDPDSTDPEVPVADWPRYAEVLSIYNEIASGN